MQSMQVKCGPPYAFSLLEFQIRSNGHRIEIEEVRERVLGVQVDRRKGFRSSFNSHQGNCRWYLEERIFVAITKKYLFKKLLREREQLFNSSGLFDVLIIFHVEAIIIIDFNFLLLY